MSPPTSRKTPKTKRKSPVLRYKSRALALLSALANESVRYTATVIAEGGPYFAGRRSPQWRIEMREKDPNIDIEKFLNDWQERSRYARAAAELQRRRFVKLVRHGGILQLEITEEGRRRLAPYTLNTKTLTPPSRWDGKWFILLFDIPETHRNARDILRKKLRELGFYQLQRSAFIWPYPCADIIDALLLGLDIQKYVTFFVTEQLGYQEVKALTHFNLRRKKIDTRRSKEK